MKIYVFFLMMFCSVCFAQLGNDPETVSGEYVALMTNGIIKTWGTNTAVRMNQLEIMTGGARVKGRQILNQSDLEFDDANYGMILINTNGQKWLLSVDNNGILFTTQIASSPEISFDVRTNNLHRARIRRALLRQRSLTNETEITTNRLMLIEQYLGLRSFTNSTP